MKRYPGRRLPFAAGRDKIGADPEVVMNVSWLSACACAAAFAVVPSHSRHSLRAVAASASDSAVVVFLGTGTPRPDPTAMGPSTAIVVGSRTFLFDAGVGVTRRFTGAHLPLGSIAGVFFTHLHSDHTLGYPDLVLTSWVMGRRTPYQVYGPHGLDAMTNAIYEAWREDIDVRTTGLEHRPPGAYRVRVHEIAPGVVYDSGGVRITAIPVQHGNWKEAYGYRIDAPDRSIVISGDTRPAASIEEAARGVDVLIHEVHPESIERPGADPSAPDSAYFAAFHTNDVQLGKLAASARPRMLVLYHFGAHGVADSEVIAAIRRQGYTGRIVIAKDLDRL
jgi:ribonuclease Z